MFELSGICKEYQNGLLFKKSKMVLNDVDLVLDRGDFIGLCGESGSGKTTLSRIALRLIAPSSGSVKLDGEDITRLSDRRMIPFRHMVQIVFQHPEGALNPEFRIGESLSEALRKSGTPRSDMKRRMDDLCDSMNINTDLLTRYPSQVSGGEIQRVAVARVLAFKPHYLFLDEPTSMLDLSVQAQLLHLIRDHAKENEMGVVLITHNLDIIRNMCGTVMIMEDGQVIANGDVGSVFTNNHHPSVKSIVDGWESQKGRFEHDCNHRIANPSAQ